MRVVLCCAVLCYAMPCSTVKWKSEEAKQADRYLSVSLSHTLFLFGWFFLAPGGAVCLLYVCTMTLARGGCAVVVGHCMGRVRLFLGAKSPSVF